MVDLGFLLITFFMYTTTMSKPKTMEINMPYKDPNMKIEDQTKIKASTAITILLSKNHRVYYYEGLGQDSSKSPEYHATSFSMKGGIRDEIIAKEKAVADLKTQGVLKATDQTTILIKPDSTSTYDDLVNILDEMSINDVRVYAIVDISTIEQENIHTTEMANGVK